MRIEITRDASTAKWVFRLDDTVISEQSTLWKLFHKAYKYAKSQGL